MNNVEALQTLYAALGGEPADVANRTTIVEVLNAISAKFGGEDNATLNPEAVNNISNIVDTIINISAVINVLGKHDTEGRVDFEQICNYNGSQSLKFGHLFYRDGELNVDMTIEAGIYSISEHGGSYSIFFSRDMGKGMYLRPFIKIGENGLYYGKQIYVKYSDLPD